MSFEQFNLSVNIMQAIAEMGYLKPTRIQQQSIPLILAGKDVLAGAETGTGKTAGFALPILELIYRQPIVQKEPCPFKALVIAPTRELAIQIQQSFISYSRYLPICSEVIVGGVRINRQIQRIARGADVLVATPGRLLDLLDQKKIDLSAIQYFVLDEADRMLDMGFIQDLHKIIKYLPADRQTLLFSATYHQSIKRLSGELMNNPIEVGSIRDSQVVKTIVQQIYAVQPENKRELLAWLIGQGHWQQVLVFTRTRHGADRLCKQLIKDGIRCITLHGDKKQGARNRSLEQFRQGKITALIATDIAARGLDIEQLPYVVNFDLPTVAEDYIHRIGRTGRSGARGEAISLVTPDQGHLLVNIEKFLGYSIPRCRDTGYEVVSLEPKKQTVQRRGRQKVSRQYLAKRNYKTRRTNLK